LLLCLKLKKEENYRLSLYSCEDIHILFR